MFDCKCNRASKHACEHQARPQGVRKKERKKERKEEEEKRVTSRFERFWFYLCWRKGKWPSRFAGRQSNPHKWLDSRKIRSVEELETLPAGTKPRTSHHRSPGEERRGKRKQSDEDWNYFKGNVGKLLKNGLERIWAFQSAYIYIYIYMAWTELNWRKHCQRLYEKPGVI